MYLLTIPFLITLLIPMIMILLAFLLNKKTDLTLEKLSPFECGFDPQSMARLPFSLHFFLITIIFLIFDVEITLIIPMITVVNFCNLTNWFLITSMFIIMLLFGTYFEWNQKMLNWSY